MRTSYYVPVLWMSAAAIVIASLGAATLSDYPPPTCDETTYASAGVSLLAHGSVAVTIFPAGTANGADVNITRFGRSYVYGLAGLFAIFGASLTTARSFSLAGWLIASILTGLLGAVSFDWRVGAAGALLVGTGTKVFLAAHLVRPEMWTTAAVLLAVILANRVVQRPSAPGWLALTAGLAAIWPADFHLLGFAFSAGLTVALGFELGLRRSWRLLSWFGAGLAVGVIAWLWTRQLNGDWTYLNQIQAVALAPVTGGAGRWLANLSGFPEWLYTVFWVAAGPISLVEAGLALMGLGLAWLRPTPPARLLVITGLISMGLFAVGTNVRWIQYAVLWGPLWALPGLAAVLLLGEQFAGRIVFRGSQALVPIMIATLIGANLAADGWLVYRYRGSNFEAMGAQFRVLTRPGSRVLADPVWWWALGSDRTFLSEDYVGLLKFLDQPVVAKFLGLPAGADTSAGLAALKARLRPDYVILDAAVGCQTDAGALSRAYSAYIAADCLLVGKVDGAWISDPSRFAIQVGQTAQVYQCRSP
jgi:hypothetical protein